jgi:DNA repair exonuclease SbcCD nuclease subunit
VGSRLLPLQSFNVKNNDKVFNPKRMITGFAVYIRLKHLHHKDKIQKKSSLYITSDSNIRLNDSSYIRLKHLHHKDKIQKKNLLCTLEF